MRFPFRPALLLIFGSMVLRAPAGTLSIDGGSGGPVVKWSGGDAHADVVTDASAGKHLGNLRYDPVVVEVPLPLAAPLVNWLNEFATGQHAAKNLVLTEIEASGRTTPVLNTLEAGGAYLTTVRFPLSDALNRAGATVVLTFGVGQARLTTTPQPGTSPTTVRTAGTVQNFRLTVAGLGASGVSKITAIEMTRAPGAGPAGDAYVTSTPTGPVRLSTLTVNLADSAAAAWKAWFTDFVINGNNDNTREKTASLEFLAGDLTTVALRLQLTQVGIARLTRQPGTMESAATVQAELYFEQLSIAALPAATSPTSQEQPATTPAPTEPAPSSPPPASDSTATSSPPPPVAPVTTTSPLIGSTRVPVAVASGSTPQIKPINTTLPQTSTMTVTPSVQPSATATTTGAVESNPADEGSRDPIDFPRVGGLTRLTFSGSIQKNYVRESATYASADDLRRVTDSVVKAAQAGGWQQASQTETGDRTVGRTVNIEWVKGSIRAQMNLTDRKPSGTTITLWVAGEKSGG